MEDAPHKLSPRWQRSHDPISKLTVLVLYAKSKGDFANQINSSQQFESRLTELKRLQELNTKPRVKTKSYHIMSPFQLLSVRLEMLYLVGGSTSS